MDEWNRGTHGNRLLYRQYDRKILPDKWEIKVLYRKQRVEDSIEENERAKKEKHPQLCMAHPQDED